MERKQLNYKFQPVDSRDHKYTAPSAAPKTAASFSLESKLKVILEQGNLGSCVSNSFAQYINIATSNKLAISRLSHYYCGRAIEGDSSLEDTGLDIRQAASIILKYGFCLEPVWPYNTDKFNIMPSLTAFQQSKLLKQYKYSFVNQDLVSLKTCLTTTKLPIIFGIIVYSSFMTDSVATTGIVPLPNIVTETAEGGHCILMLGYNDTTQQFTCVNSWSSSWGNKGLFYLPYAYVTDPNLASDFCSLSFIY